jgi:hypothetical protein
MINDHKQLIQFIGEVIFNSVGAVGQETRDVVDNILTMVNNAGPADWEGRSPWYSTFGVSSIVYPGVEIHERYSIGFAIKLIERTLKVLEAPAQLPQSETNKNFIQSFIVDNNLEVENQRLLEKICPVEDLPEYTLEKSINLRDSDYPQDCKLDLDEWSENKRKVFEKRINSTREDLKENINNAISTLLDDIKEGEAAKKEKCPKGSYGAAVSLLNSHLENNKGALSKMKSQLDDELPKYPEQSKKLLNGFPAPPKFPMFPTTPQRNAYSNYAEARQQELQSKCKIKRIELAIELCTAWKDRIGVIARDVEDDEDMRESTQGKLKHLISDLCSRGNTLRSEQLHMRQALFEIYIGDVTDKGDDQTYVWEGFKEPPIEDSFKEFQREIGKKGITDWGKLGGLNSGKLDDLFMSYARKKLRSGTDLSVLDVLKDLDHRKEGTMARIVKQAIDNSTLLLPLNDTLLGGKDQDIAEFCVIGGEDKESLAKALDDSIPSDSRIPNLWASTGDRYRITICRYFAAVPLHVINGIKDIRTAYFKRFRPPSHTDLNFEFELPDAIPETEPETRALALLCLALLEVNENKQEKRFGLEQEALIVRVNPLEKPKYYRLDPLVLGGHVPDEEDLRLPGMPSGKFYTLYDELSGDIELQKKLIKILLELDEQDGFYEALLKDAKRKHSEYKDLLRRAQEGKEPPFTHMRTGYYYRREVMFYAEMLRDKPTIKKMLRL